MKNEQREKNVDSASEYSESEARDVFVELQKCDGLFYDCLCYEGI